MDEPRKQRPRASRDGPEDQPVERNDVFRQHGMVLSRTLRHNLRNRLTTIKGNAERIATRVSGEEQAASETIIEEADRLLGLAEKELVLTGILKHQPDKRPILLGNALRRLVHHMREKHPAARIHLRVHCSTTVSAIPAIELAAEELVRNAIEHNPNPNPRVWVSLSKENEQCHLTVADDSDLIPQREKRVLRDIEKMDQLNHSSGIGLWMVRWIVDFSGGEFAIGVSDTGGNEVSVTLPAAD